MAERLPKHLSRPLRDVDGGWAWVVLFAAFCSFAVISGLFYTFGIYFSLLLEVFGESRSYTAWVGSLNSAFFQISGPIGSMVIVKFGCRTAIMMGGIICAVGFILTSMAKAIVHFFFSYGLVVAVGYNLVYSGLVVSLGQYFERRHALAVGLAMAGSGCGLLAIGPIIQTLIDNFGWRGALLINGGLTLQFCVFGALVYPLPNAVSCEDIIGSHASLRIPKDNVWSRNLFTDSKFWCLNFSCFFWVMGGLIVFTISHDYAVSCSLGDHYTLALIGLGVGDIAGRLLGGFIASCHQISTLFYYSLASLACSGVILLHMLVSEPIHLFFVSAIFSFCYGQQSVLLPIAPAALFGSRKLALIFGYILFMAGVGTLIGPPVAGWIIDESHSYNGAFGFAGISNFQAAICMFLVYLMDRHRHFPVTGDLVPATIDAGEITIKTPIDGTEGDTVVANGSFVRTTIAGKNKITSSSDSYLCALAGLTSRNSLVFPDTLLEVGTPFSHKTPSVDTYIYILGGLGSKDDDYENRQVLLADPPEEEAVEIPAPFYETTATETAEELHSSEECKDDK